MFKVWIVLILGIFTAAGISFADEVRGKAVSVDKAKKAIQISGVLVKADEAWVENEKDYPLALSDIAAGDYLEVDGKFTGASEIKAGKIERHEPECGFVKGRITSMDTGKRQIVISGIVIKVPADAWLEGPNHVRIPIELFAPGYSVECRGDWTGAGELTAFKVSVK